MDVLGPWNGVTNVPVVVNGSEVITNLPSEFVRLFAFFNGFQTSTQVLG
ncbi:MAG: hypothetical protein JWO95_56 [Verrucomicrobiales bacterium]|nr:hypothetical protein [Verrucomicrobiales bacterium]